MVRSNGSQKSHPAENYVAQSAMYSGLRHEDRRNAKIHPDVRRRRAMAYDFTKNYVAQSATVGDIPNRYTSDVVLNQQARVAHGGGMADHLSGGPVAGKTMAVQGAGAYGGSKDRPMAGCLVVHDIV
jgi:hypothetical protein